ncbi:HAMP domain-containing histidine kinase [Sphingomonas sp. BN140010]|uniref:histidine kinase n=1 Tax=Sphingomonas arvum TaxID=2992113 RepID=A0ABT3JE77_9SPHN|nr:HAMP domain-containing sensor histidine kinase [Sphingomonas sp. BN140010]MCW3797341.1 HAMP domain-containing histidine kinase [Sphingomonas sp. BN140010]
MASTAPDPIRGSVDEHGRLVRADPPLARLQEAAGSRLGAVLAVPQLSDIARLARQLGVTLSRPALAATDSADLDLWVRAEPLADRVELAIESWIERPARGARWPLADLADPPSTSATPAFTTDAELRLLTLTPAAATLLAATAAEALGQPLTGLLDLRPDPDGSLPLLTAVALRREFTGQRAAIRSSGAELLVAGEPRLSPDGGFAGLQCQLSSRDSPPVETATASFDALLREPLDVIVDEAERIADKAEGPLRSDYAAYATDIAGAARHLLEVLQAMGQEAATSGRPERIDLAELALEAAGLVQAQASEAGVTLDIDGVPTLSTLGQPRQVTQILVNLIGNAIRHSPASGVVRITSEAGAMASVTVADQGPGVAPADAERIFERFEQVEPQGVGAGLGLAISRRLAQQMGGNISLESKAGEGARFTLSLPLA